MRAAQAGDERAFARLWRDANPLVVRYLRVIGVEDPYDSACEGWVSIVRGVHGFEGDEKAWRLWVCTCARMSVEEGSLRSSWSPFSSRNPGVEAALDTFDDIDFEELMQPGVAPDLQHRDVNATIHALAKLPMGQGEVVDLRYGWGLPPEDVAGLVGIDATKVRKTEARALERLDTPADLLEWSLNAPPTPAELADERIATAVFRSTPHGSRNPVGKARIIALGTGGPGRPSRRSTRVGRSRTALLGIATLSASMMSVGGLSAAAYVGVLPAPVQQIAHDVVGAPPPAARTAQAPSGKPLGSGAVPTVGVGPDGTAKAAPGLCRAWVADKGKGTPRSASAAFRALSRAAGGDGAVDGYCATVLSTEPGNGRGAPTAGTRTPNPNSPTKGSSKPTTTKTPGSSSTKTPKAPTTKVPTTKAPTTKAPTTKTPTTRAPKPTSTKAPKVTPTQGGGKQATPSAASSPAPTAAVDDPGRPRSVGQPADR